MDDLDYEHRLTETEQRSKSNTKRIDKLEESNEAINSLAKSMERMSERQDQAAKTLDRLDGKVTALENKPGKRWESIVDKTIWAVVAAIITFLLTRIGL